MPIKNILIGAPTLMYCIGDSKYFRPISPTTGPIKISTCWSKREMTVSKVKFKALVNMLHEDRECRAGDIIGLQIYYPCDHYGEQKMESYEKVKIEKVKIVLPTENSVGYTQYTFSFLTDTSDYMESKDNASSIN